jgi:hypothetical protein
MDRKKTKSARLKKYEIVYKEYIKNKSRSPEKTHKPIRESHIEIKKLPDSKKKVKKKLTEYQKFVKKESKKEKYKGLKADERMAKIAKSWKKRQK